MTEKGPHLHHIKPAIVGFGLVTSLVGCGTPEPPKPAKIVLLITIDALRADSVGWAVGSSFDTTPNLSELAIDSVVFDQAVTSFPGTTASMPSLMTGLFPNFEGVSDWNNLTYHGFNEFETAEEAAKPALSGNLRLLAEILGEHGFRTIGFNTNPNLTQARNFDQGFGEYEDFRAYMKAAQEKKQHPLEGAYPPADVVMARVVPTIRELAAQPSFMWVHLMESHSPYLPPEPHARVSPRTRTARSDLEVNEALYRFLYLQWGAKPENISFPSLDELGITKAELTEHLLGLYEGEIHFCDAELGKLIETMRGLGLLEDTLIVITADHGEEFFDHGYVTHHFKSALAEELIRIPLLIRPPGGVPGGRRVEELVRMVDIAPTILDAVGLGGEAIGMDGVSLRPALDGGRLDDLTAYYSTIDHGIVRTDRWKYRLEKAHPSGAESVERLFDIRADPMETTDVAGERPDVLARLRADWEAFALRLSQRGVAAEDSTTADTAGVEIDAETKEQLEALGYAE